MVKLFSSHFRLPYLRQNSFQLLNLFLLFFNGSVGILHPGNDTPRSCNARPYLRERCGEIFGRQGALIAVAGRGRGRGGRVGEKETGESGMEWWDNIEC